MTGNLGFLYKLAEPVALVLNVGRGFRAPSSFDLFSNGVHEGTVAFERGDPNLKTEKSLEHRSRPAAADQQRGHRGRRLRQLDQRLHLHRADRYRRRRLGIPDLRRDPGQCPPRRVRERSAVPPHSLAASAGYRRLRQRHQHQHRQSPAVDATIPGYLHGSLRARRRRVGARPLLLARWRNQLAPDSARSGRGRVLC